MNEKVKTRGERRLEILARIAELHKHEEQREAADWEMELRALGLERDLIDSWQIADHFRHRLEKVRAVFAASCKEQPCPHVKEIDADWRENEPGLPLPTCPHCGKGLIP